MPEPTRRAVGVALRGAQGSSKARHPAARPYTTAQHKGWSIVEIAEDHDTDTYRAFYTSHFADVVFVLCAFKKKSTQGIATPSPKKELIEIRYDEAKRIAGAPPAQLRAAMMSYRAEVSRATVATSETPTRKRR